MVCPVRGVAFGGRALGALGPTEVRVLGVRLECCPPTSVRAQWGILAITCWQIQRGLCAQRVRARLHFQLLYPDVWMNTRVTSGSICVCVACLHDQGTQIMTGVHALGARLGRVRTCSSFAGPESVRGTMHALGAVIVRTSAGPDHVRVSVNCLRAPICSLLAGLFQIC